MKRVLLYLQFAALSLAAQAQDSGLVLHYDFENVSGTSVPDRSATGASATLQNDATVVTMGSHHVLSLGSGTGYLDMGTQAGQAFIASDTYAISASYYIAPDHVLEGNGHFLWTFASTADCNQTTGHYQMYRLNAQTVGTSANGWGSEVGSSLGSASERGRWINVVYQVSSGQESLYVNGELKAQRSGIPANSANFGTSVPSCCWLGRACFNGDNYLQQTFIDDFRVYNRLLSAQEISERAAEATALDADYLDSALRLHFDFNQASGKNVIDQVGGTITATAQSSASIAEMGTYKVLSLGAGSGYLNMTEQAGQIFRACDDFTISTYYCVDATADLSGFGRFLWCFSTSAACTADAGKYHHYRLNVQRCETSTGGYGTTYGYERGSESEKGRWIHVAYTVGQGTCHLYIDGVEVGTATDIPLNSTNFGNSAVSYCWLGRSCFSGDNYLQNTLVYDFRLYDRALTQREIQQLGSERTSLDYQYLYGSEGDKTALNNAIATAQAYLDGCTPSQYPQGAIDDLNDALTYARSIAASSRASQVLCDRTTTRLNAALDLLKSKKGQQFVLPEGGTENNLNRGFKHPGLLHTEADFERIRAQLAAGNPTVTEAYNQLVASKYANVTGIYVPEVIYRGGDSPQNYKYVMEAAAIAYQNALRWKIEGNRTCADHAVHMMNEWARYHKLVSGDSNWALCAGLQGYQFANAAELMRDYDGWSREDFEAFKQYMLTVWYNGNIQFLRYRNGTWENPGKWWRAPGHYWSNWPLCNALSAISIGVLCDDPFIYNQGMSYFKYDQCGTFNDPRPEGEILSDGLTEFLGNFVVTTAESELETGAYGRLGQMQESGRDGGHAAMALGLAVDIAKTGWNQGDDLFAYMDHRLAAGIEFMAGQILSVEGMPWTNYHRFESGFAWTDSRSWVMTGYAMPAETRAYWGTIIGHYEGVKGITMPLSDRVFEGYQPDPVTNIAVSSNADHLGYSVLMNTRDVRLAPANKVPTELRPKMTYSGTLNGYLIPFIEREQARGTVSSNAKVSYHNELGAVVNNYWDATQAVPTGQTVTLEALLPDGESDTGLWQWETGETTKSITVSTDQSHVYRVTYTNQNGVQSQQCFSIAATGDCLYTPATQTITVDGNYVGSTEAEVNFGTAVTLTVQPTNGVGSYQWSNGETTNAITLPNVSTERDVYCVFTNYGGRRCLYTFHLTVSTTGVDELILDENAGSFTPLPGTYETVRLRADLSNRWQTICLPFDMTHAQLEQTFGTGTSIVRLNAANGTMLNFLQVPNLQAHRPYLLQPGIQGTEFLIHDAVISAPTSDDLTDEVGDVRFIGTYSPVTTGIGFYSVTGGRISPVTDATPVLPFHAYFDFSSAAHAKAYIDQLGGIVTGIGMVQGIGQEVESVVYDLSGKRVASGFNAMSTLRPGLYILREGQHSQKILIH
ncbi:MAG: alginate lyase family protein [Bacteroidaceae bacterium]|nr:alginate lyase family protein [Bacteroidaceae bacterium]